MTLIDNVLNLKTASLLKKKKKKKNRKYGLSFKFVKFPSILQSNKKKNILKIDVDFFRAIRR